METVKVGEIFRTTDYSQFGTIKGNRPPASVEKIKKSIEKVGYVLSPILVNEKMQVIDGQNRLLALKALGYPVDYMVAPGAGEKECIALNIGQSNWKTRDYIHYYAENMNGSYMRLCKLLETYRDIPLEAMIFIAKPKQLAYTTGGSITTQIKEGTFDLSDERMEQAIERVEKMISLGFVEYYRRNKMFCRTWFGAVVYAIMHPQVDERRLARQIKKNPEPLVACGKLVEQLAAFDRVYNSGLRKENKVFMSTDYQRGLYL